MQKFNFWKANPNVLRNNSLRSGLPKPTLCINIQRLLTAQIKKIHNSQRKELWIFSLNCPSVFQQSDDQLGLNAMSILYFTYSAKSVRRMSPLRASVSWNANAAGRLCLVCPPFAIFR